MNVSELSSADWERIGGDEYLHFERIPPAERLHPSALLSGLLKLAGLTSAPANFGMEGGYEIVYLARPHDLPHLTEADIIYLYRCGIHFDEETEYLAAHC